MFTSKPGAYFFHSEKKGNQIARVILWLLSIDK